MPKSQMAIAELKVLNLLWEYGTLPAKEIAKKLSKSVGWNKNTTYTLIKRCIQKGAIERSEPNFMCKALLTKEDFQRSETIDFTQNVYGGNINLLFASLLSQKGLKEDEINSLLELINSYDQK